MKQTTHVVVINSTNEGYSEVPTDIEIKHTVLRKMLYHGYIGGKHTSIENLPKGFPKDCKKRVNKIVDKMIKEGYFKLKPKPDSLHVSLEPKMLQQIKEELEQDQVN